MSNDSLAPASQILFPIDTEHFGYMAARANGFFLATLVLEAGTHADPVDMALSCNRAVLSEDRLVGFTRHPKKVIQLLTRQPISARQLVNHGFLQSGVGHHPENNTQRLCAGRGDLNSEHVAKTENAHLAKLPPGIAT